MQPRDRTAILTKGTFASSNAFAAAMAEVEAAVKSVAWPAGTNSFTINPTKHGNGVRPIRDAFTADLAQRSWSLEKRFEREPDPATRLPGEFDAHREFAQPGPKPFVVEWETGNISSSHRALNKMALALLRGHLSGGLLVMPTRALYPYLTDRIGSLDEIAPYFDLWAALPIDNGYLGVLAVEHDATSSAVPLIPKGTDGRALV